MKVFWSNKLGILVIYDEFPDIHSFWDNLSSKERELLYSYYTTRNLERIWELLDLYPIPHSKIGVIKICFGGCRFKRRKWITSRNIGRHSLVQIIYENELSVCDPFFGALIDKSILFLPKLRKNPKILVNRIYKRILEDNSKLVGRKIDSLFSLIIIWWKINKS